MWKLIITITSLFREVKVITTTTTLIINIKQQNTTKVLLSSTSRAMLPSSHSFSKNKGCIPTPKTLKLYDYKCFYLLGK